MSASGDLSVNLHRDGVVQVVTVAGDIDLYTCPTLQADLDAAVDGPRQDGAPLLVVDLAGVGFMDSAGLGVLVGTYKKVRAAHGAMVLAGASGSTRRLLDITGLTKVLASAEDVRAAVGQPSAKDGEQRAASGGGDR